MPVDLLSGLPTHVRPPFDVTFLTDPRVGWILLAVAAFGLAAAALLVLLAGAFRNGGLATEKTLERRGPRPLPVLFASTWPQSRAGTG
jgi:hypothetical protein